MTFAECAAYIRGLQRRDRDQWEQTRRIVHAIVQVNSSKSLELGDVMKFPWDDEENMTEEEVIERQQNEERELRELRERAKKLRL